MGLTQATTQFGNKIFIEQSMVSESTNLDHLDISKFRHDKITEERRLRHGKIKKPLEILTRNPMVIRRTEEEYNRATSSISDAHSSMRESAFANRFIARGMNQTTTVGVSSPQKDYMTIRV